MDGFLCALPYLLLGAAIAAPIFWYLGRWSRHTSAPLTCDTITGFNPACEEAFGECAKPSNLRHMEEADIVRHLNRGQFDNHPRPDANVYRTWPYQAERLYAGEYAALRAYQDGLSGDRSDDEAGILPPRPDNQARRGPGDHLALVLFLLLILATILSFIVVFRNPQWCERGSTTTDLEPPEVRLRISTDLLFDFNRYRPTSNIHADLVKTSLARQIGQYRDIRIIGIQAHTDPIGSASFNRTLANKRAEYVRSILNEIKDTAKPGVFVGEPIPPSLVDQGGPSPSGGDRAVWNQCFAKFQSSVADKPLEDLPAGLEAEGRPACLQQTASADAGPYPACRRLSLPRPSRRDRVIRIPRSALTGYARRAENFRELTTCLGPMRHVEISFEHATSGSDTVATPQAGRAVN